MRKRSKTFLVFFLAITLLAMTETLSICAQDFKRMKKNGVEILVPNYPIESGKQLGQGRHELRRDVFTNLERCRLPGYC
jgi:hypothetical protein